MTGNGRPTDLRSTRATAPRGIWPRWLSMGPVPSIAGALLRCCRWNCSKKVWLGQTGLCPSPGHGTRKEVDNVDLEEAPVLEALAPTERVARAPAPGADG